jgi:hypothetical protein
MKEGTGPVPPYRPCTERDDDELPLRGVLHFSGEHKTTGLKSSCAFSVFLSTSPAPFYHKVPGSSGPLLSCRRDYFLDTTAAKM